MYLSQHSAVGVAITMTGYLLGGPEGALLSVPLAFGSHYVLDAFGEHAYGASFPPSKQTIIWEGIPFIMFLIGALISGVWWVFALGWISSTAMDIWDKGSWLLHDGDSKYGHTFHPIGRKPIVYLSSTMTKTTAIMSGIFFILIGYLNSTSL